MGTEKFSFRSSNESLINFLRTKNSISETVDQILQDVLNGKYVLAKDLALEHRKQEALVHRLELQCKKLELEIKYFNFVGKVPSKVFVEKVLNQRSFSVTEEIEILDFFTVTKIDSYTNVSKIQCKHCFYNCRVSEDEKVKNASDHILKDHSDLIK